MCVVWPLGGYCVSAETTGGSSGLVHYALHISTRTKGEGEREKRRIHLMEMDGKWGAQQHNVNSRRSRRGEKNTNESSVEEEEEEDLFLKRRE